MLKQWFLRPSLSLPLLQQRHNTVACFLRSQNMHVAAAIGKSLARIKNIPKVLAALRKGKAKASDWTSILQVCYRYQSKHAHLMVLTKELVFVPLSEDQIPHPRAR